MANSDGLTQPEIIQIAREAYTYGFPLVMMDLTKQVQTNLVEPSGGHAPINQVGKAQTFPTSATTEVVKPNVDTLYNIVWFDLTQDAFVINMPHTGTKTYSKQMTPERYYLLPFLDAYSNVFTSPGTRHTSSKSLLLLITGPGWEGTVPDNMTQIKAPTPMVWMLGRIQGNNDADAQQIVWPLQQQLNVTPLGQWNNPAYTPPQGNYDPNIDSIEPVNYVFTLSFEDFINQMTTLMAENPPPLPQDQLILDKMKSIGIEPGGTFDINAFPPETRALLDEIPRTSVLEWEKAIIPQLQEKGEIQNNWVNIIHQIGRYEDNYLNRAFIAYKGLGANLVEDAIYPVCEKDASGSHLVGGVNYKLTFLADQLPPVGAFWSLTAYDYQDFLVENTPQIYSVGSRGALNYNSDGSLDIYIQHSQPDDATKNWLPSPPDRKMSLTLRLYWPGESVVDGSWQPPAVVVNQG